MPLLSVNGLEHDNDLHVLKVTRMGIHDKSDLAITKLVSEPLYHMQSTRVLIIRPQYLVTWMYSARISV